MDIDKFSYSANLAAELAALELQVADKKSQLLRSLGVDLATTMSGCVPKGHSRFIS
jgi:hypothetical protein